MRDLRILLAHWRQCTFISRNLTTSPWITFRLVQRSLVGLMELKPLAGYLEKSSQLKVSNHPAYDRLGINSWRRWFWRWACTTVNVLRKSTDPFGICSVCTCTIIMRAYLYELRSCISPWTVDNGSDMHGHGACRWFPHQRRWAWRWCTGPRNWTRWCSSGASNVSRGRTPSALLGLKYLTHTSTG